MSEQAVFTRLSDSPDALLPIRAAGRYFETTDQTPFLFIGPNEAISWAGLSGLYRRRSVDSVERYLAGMAANGITVIRLMLEYTHTDGWFFEKPVGRMNPIMVRYWDDLLRLCQRCGLRVLLTPWDTFWMSRRWHKHPYNAANGGPAAQFSDFLTDEGMFRAIVERFRFVVERWGDTGVIAAWDLFNEIHPLWGGTPTQQAAALSRLSHAIREIEMCTWGFTRPQTVSIFGPGDDAQYEELIFRHPDLDFATTHIYHSAIDYPEDTVQPALVMRQWVEHALRMTHDRPYTDSEHGPIHLFNDLKQHLPEDFDETYERHLIWAHLASGGAGSGMRWPARHPHVITAGMQHNLGSMAQFAKHLHWPTLNPMRLAGRVQVNAPEVHLFGCGDTRQAVLWLLKTHPQRTPLTASVDGFVCGRYAVVAWDTGKGLQALQTLTETDEDGTLPLALPAFERDLAVAIRPAEPR